jgi:hypothetical protein
VARLPGTACGSGGRPGEPHRLPAGLHRGLGILRRVAPWCNAREPSRTAIGRLILTPCKCLREPAGRLLMFPGVTSRCRRSMVGSRRIRAASTARSAQSSRGRGFARRSTAISCRNTSSSTSFGRRGATQQNKPTTESNEDQIHQSQPHIPRSCLAPSTGGFITGQARSAVFWNLTRSSGVRRTTSWSHRVRRAISLRPFQALLCCRLAVSTVLVDRFAHNWYLRPCKDDEEGRCEDAGRMLWLAIGSDTERRRKSSTSREKESVGRDGRMTRCDVMVPILGPPASVRQWR